MNFAAGDFIKNTLSIVTEIANSLCLSHGFRYALWEARRYAGLRRDPGAWACFTPRQRFKYRHLAKWWYPWFYFVFSYLAKLGFLDGGAGLHYAAYKAWYFQTIRLLIKERQAA